jgi:hypothetical protein
MAEKSFYPVVLIGKNKNSAVPVALRDERGAPRKLSGCEQFGCRSLVLSDESVVLAWRARSTLLFAATGRAAPP